MDKVGLEHVVIDNKEDGLFRVHRRYFDFVLQMGVDQDAVRNRRPGVAKALGNGHAVIQIQPLGGRPIATWAPMFGEDKRAEFEALQQQFVDRFGAARAHMITQTSRNLLIFPNLIINDIMAITVRTFFPAAPDFLEITAWALGPKEESPENRTLRLDNFLTFLGPGGYATPDDVEALESCQRGFANREVAWSDISRGMKRDQPISTDELQMRAFWRQWHASMTQAPPACVTVRPAVAVS
ncbi:MAG: SRPBCC family protein [Candidatus Tectomicrobia bacterium]